MKIRIASTLALASIITLAAPSFAFDVNDLLRGYLGVNTNNLSNSTEQNVIRNNFATRQTQLKDQVTAGVTSGQLTPQEETELRADLSRIDTLESNYLADGKLDNMEVQSILNEFTNFSIKIQSYISNSTVVANTVPAYGTSGNGWYRRHLRGSGDQHIQNRVQFQADIDTKQAQIDAAITQGTSSGLLNWNETANLRAELNRINTQEISLSADGHLSYRDAKQLTDSLDALSTRVNKQLADNQFRGNRGRGYGRGNARGRSGQLNASVDARQSLLRQRIYQGIKDGRLTQGEADRLLQRETQIADLQTRLTLSGNRLTYNEQHGLLDQLSNLSNAINKELSDKQVR